MLNISTLTPKSFTINPKPDDGQNPRKRKRNRKVLVCQPCHRHKQKCDRNQPCSRCVAAERPDQCVYESVSSVNSKDKSGNQDVVDDNGEHSTSPDYDGASLPTRLAVPAIDSSSRGKSTPKTHSVMHYHKGRIRYSGATHWAQLVFQFDEMRSFMMNRGQVLADVKKREKAVKSMYAPRKKRTFPFGDAVGSMSDFQTMPLSFLPPRPIVEATVDCYLATFDKLFPLFHRATFHEEIAKFYEDQESVENSWLAQLYMVLALGGFSSAQPLFEDYPGGATGFTERMIDGAEATFTQTAFLYKPDQTKFTTIRVLCMIAIAKQMELLTYYDSDSCWQYMGFVVRQAMAMLLHRNPDVFDTMPLTESDTRKRIWTTVALLDMTTSIDSGMQMQCRPGDCDSPPPLTRSDGVEAADNFYFDRLSKTLPILRDIINDFNSPAPNIEYDDVLKLDATLRGLLKGIESQRSNASSARTVSTEVQRITLGNMIRRVLLAVHQPWARDGSHSPHYETSHWTILECALAILRRHQFLRDDPNLQWASVLFHEDFKLSVIHVCLGLRRRHFSDTPEHGSLKSAKELAWDMVRFAYENARANLHRDTSKMKAFIGILNMKAILEAMDKGDVFDPLEVLRTASAQAWDIVEERMRAVRPAQQQQQPPQQQLSRAASLDKTADSVGWSPTTSTGASNGYAVSPWIMGGIIDPSLGVNEDLFGDFDSPFDEFIEGMFLK